MTRSFAAVGAGFAYTDWIAQVDHELLKHHDLTSGTPHHVSLERLRALQSQVPDAKLVPNGPAANAMATLAALGGKAGYFGKVNDGKTGNAFLGDLKSRGVELCCQPYDKSVGLSPTRMFLHNQGEALAYNPGCAEAFKAEDFANFDFESADFFFLEAFLLAAQDCSPVIIQALNRARDLQTRIAFSLHDHVKWQYSKPAIRAILEYASVIFGNLEEIEAFKRCFKGPVPPHITLVTTDGVNGVKAQLGNKLISLPSLKPKQLVNSKGAGDALAAGYLMGQHLGYDMDKSLRLGVQAATAVLEEPTPRPAPHRSLAHLLELCELQPTPIY